jgi:hypothetical protein
VEPKPASPLGNADDEWGDMPPPPDNFPDDWDSEWQPSFEQATLAARPEPKPDPKPVVPEPRRQIEFTPPEIKPDVQKNPPVPREPSGARALQQIEPVQLPPIDFLPSLYIPLAQED